MSRNTKEAMPNNEQQETEEQKIPVDGFQQVVEMLKVADPAFRDSLLKRLAVRDKSLADSLKRDLVSR